MPRSNFNKESGNVFVIIFIAVILFAALGYTFTKSANKGTGNLTKQQAKIAAQDIINYANLFNRAVERARLNGCSETDISFSTTASPFGWWGSSYDHVPDVEDKCKLFNDNGGKLQWKDVPDNWIDRKGSTDGYWHLIGTVSVVGIGSNAPDLLAVLPSVTEEICSEINNTLGLGTDIPLDSGNFDSHHGTTHFSGASDYTIWDYVPGPATHCIKEDFSGGRYMFFHTLIPR